MDSFDFSGEKRILFMLFSDSWKEEDDQWVEEAPLFLCYLYL